MAAMDVRVDKWLWAVRVFKTRNLASVACKKGKVRINGAEVRSSKTVRVNDCVTVSFPGIERIYRAISLIDKRVGARLAALAVKEETPAADLERLELMRRDPLSILFAVRLRGSGRPSKKERRDLDRLTDPGREEEKENPDEVE